MKFVSWNVNGIRAIYKKGFVEWLKKGESDIICIQETKAHKEQLPDELVNIDGYKAYFSSAEKKGYSGVAVYSKIEPINITTGFVIKKMDIEGRILMLEYEKFILFNIYFPNGKASSERLKYKMDFYDVFLDKAVSFYKNGKNVIICGDVNTAHKEIDLARPKENEKNSGFLPEEREWIDKFLDCGFIDTFRIFNKEPGQYSWWDYKTRARDRNIGWRIDYFFISRNLENNINNAFIESKVSGSDHCPIGIEIDF